MNGDKAWALMVEQLARGQAQRDALPDKFGEAYVEKFILDRRDNIVRVVEHRAKPRQ